MNKFCPTVPNRSKTIVRGNLYWSDDPEDLGQDMLEVKFETGELLCAGWVPEEDPKGEYQITVRMGLKLVSKHRTKSFTEAQSYIQGLVWATGVAAPGSTSAFAADGYVVYRHDHVGKRQLVLA
jgi:hypothetical protein